jgi:ubiquitin thioesterase OTU1
MKIRLSVPGQPPKVVTLDESDSLEDLLGFVFSLSGIPPTEQKLIIGSGASATLRTDDRRRTLALLGIRDRVSLRVVCSRTDPTLTVPLSPVIASRPPLRAAGHSTLALPPLSPVPLSAPPSPPRPSVPRRPSPQHIRALSSYENPLEGAGDRLPPLVPPDSQADVVPVPPDGSCLFRAVTYVLSDVVAAPVPASFLRTLCYQHIRHHPAVYDRGLLGEDPETYAAAIAADDTWGGGIELKVLAEESGVELVAIDLKSGRQHVFGEGLGFLSRAYLLFDGSHYDPLVVQIGAGTEQRVFRSGDALAEGLFAAFIPAVREKRRYTSLASFSLRCCVCNTGLTGAADAQMHAKKTGHASFEEVNK